MTVKELATAAAFCGPHPWEKDTIPPDSFVYLHRDAYKCCGPLLYHDPHDDTVNLVHQSAKDYLMTLDPQSLYSVDWHEASMDMIKASWKYLAAPDFEHGHTIISRSKTNGLMPANLSGHVLEKYGFLGYATEELRDGGLVERRELVAEFVWQSESLSELPVLRDYWLLKLVAAGHVEGARALVDKDADFTVRQFNETPWGDCYEVSILVIASTTGDVALVRLLVSRGCECFDPDVKDDGSSTSNSNSSTQPMKATSSRQADETTSDSHRPSATLRDPSGAGYRYAASDL